jgi:cell division protein FtsI/penicillin-binding protein 2
VAVVARRPPGMRARKETSRLRVLWLLALALMLATAIWGRLAYWQLLRHGDLSLVAARYHMKDITLAPGRGVIYDRNGHALAMNTVVYDVALMPDLVRTPEDRAQVEDGLSSVLGLPRQQVLDVLAAGGSYTIVRHRQPQDKADQLRRLKLAGVALVPQSERTYVQGGTPDVSLASSLLGFVDDAGHGQRGLERFYDGRLAGRPGFVSTYRDLLGNEVALGSQRRREPVNGTDVTLTIDSTVQNTAEQAIADGVKAARAESGSVLVMDSKTGAVVAWASYPAYDANQFRTADPARTRDPIASDLYEPGSVMKVVTLAGAMDAGKITPDTTIQDPGYIVVDRSTLRDWDLTAHGTVTMTNVLERSLNVGAVKAMQAEGRDSFLHYLEAFGITAPTHVDVAAEARPLQPSTQWRNSELATASFGQGVAVNMVQMTAAINVIANQGRWVQPHVVERIGTTPAPPPQTRQVVSPQTAASMSRMMASVVQHGSGWTARVQGFETNQAGKTGTSQMPENGTYSQDHVWASYTGFLPADDPRFTMLVVIRRPNNGSQDHNEGYYVSAPVWKRIAEQIILDWRITPGAVSPSN